MSETKPAIVEAFLQAFMEDDQLWVAGSPPDIARMLSSNIDDRGRVNGRRVLKHFLDAGVPGAAAKALLDRFVALRRQAMSSGEGAPLATDPRLRAPSGPVPAAPASDPERTVALSRDEVRPDAPTAASRDPVGQVADAPQIRPSASPSGTFRAAASTSGPMARSPIRETSHPGVRRPSRSDPRIAAEVTDPRMAGAAATEISGESGKRRASEIRGTPVAASPTPPPPVVDTTPYSTGAEVSGKRKASEIRGAPVAASASASNPRAAAPPPPAAALPKEFQGMFGDAKKQKDERQAEVDASKAAAQKADSRAPRPVWIPEGNVFVVAAAAILGVAALTVTVVPPTEAASPPIKGGLTCTETFEAGPDLLCVIDAATAETRTNPSTIQRAETMEAQLRKSSRMIWFFTEDRQAWHPVRPLPPPAPRVAKAAPPPTSAPQSDDDIVKGLLPTAMPDKPPPSSARGPDNDEEAEGPGLFTSGMKESDKPRALREKKKKKKKTRKKKSRSRKRRSRGASSD